jgi:hypothetical protein
VPSRAAELAAVLTTQTRAVGQAMAALPPAGRNPPAAAFAVARRFELCFAGAAVLHLLAAPDGTARAVRLTAALERCVELLVPGHLAPPGAYEPLALAPAHRRNEPAR